MWKQMTLFLMMLLVVSCSFGVERPDEFATIDQGGVDIKSDADLKDTLANDGHVNLDSWSDNLELSDSELMPDLFDWDSEAFEFEIDLSVEIDVFVDCDDDNVCTKDSYDPELGECVNELLFEGCKQCFDDEGCPDILGEYSCMEIICLQSQCMTVELPDGTLCGAEGSKSYCVEGECVNAVCDDDDPCTTDSWLPADSKCLYEPIEDCQICENIEDCEFSTVSWCENSTWIMPFGISECLNGVCTEYYSEYLCDFGCSDEYAGCFQCAEDNHCPEPKLDCICVDYGLLECVIGTACIDWNCEVQTEVIECEFGCDIQFAECFECLQESDCEDGGSACELPVCVAGYCGYDEIPDCTPCDTASDCDLLPECNCQDDFLFCPFDSGTCQDGVCHQEVDSEKCQFGCPNGLDSCYECLVDEDCQPVGDWCTCMDDNTIKSCTLPSSCDGGYCFEQGEVTDCPHGCDPDANDCFVCGENEDCPVLANPCLVADCYEGYCQYDPKPMLSPCGEAGSWMYCVEDTCVDFDCNDGNACTKDLFDFEQVECVHVTYDDCWSCETSETCQKDPVCQCTAISYDCWVFTGECVEGACEVKPESITCDYGCNPQKEECFQCGQASDCEDFGDPCLNTVCNDGYCETTSKPDMTVCPPNDQFHYCVSGTCQAFNCEDNNPCTNDFVSIPKQACDHTLIFPGCETCQDKSECNDNMPCTYNKCEEGICQYPIVVGCVPCQILADCQGLGDGCDANGDRLDYLPSCVNGKCAANWYNCNNGCIDGVCF